MTTCTGAVRRLGSSLDSPSRGARADTPFGRCWPSSASMPPQPGFPHLRRAQVVPFTWRGCLQASLPRVLPVPWSSEIHACLPPPRFEGTPPIPRGPALPPRPSALPPHPPGFVSDNPVWVCVPVSSGPVLGVESTVPGVSVAQPPPSSRGHRGSLWHLTSGSSPECLWGLAAEHVCVLRVGSAGGGLVVGSWPYWARSPRSLWGTWAGSGASSARCPSCGPVPVGRAAVVPSQTCAPRVTAPVSPAGRPCAPAQASVRGPPPDSVAGVAWPFLGSVPRCPLPKWASLVTLSMGGCEDGPPGCGEGLLRRAARADRCLDFPRIKVN